MSKKVTEKSTKAEIMEEYRRLQKELEEKESVVHNPAKIVEENKKQEVIKKVESVKTNTLESIVNKFTNEIEKANEEIAKYNEIKEGIRVKEEELKTLFEIEKNAFSATALEIAQKQTIEKFDAEIEQKRKEIDDYVQQSKEQIETMKKETREEMKAEKQEENKKQEREEEEWKYNFERAKKEKEDELEDLLQAKRKIHAEKVEVQEREIARRLLEVGEREDKIEKLHEEIATLNSKLVAIEEETKEKVKQDLEKSHGFKVRYMEKEHEAETSLLQNRIDMLLAENERLALEKADMSKRLDESYNKIESLANKSVESASNSKYMNSLEGIAKNNNSSK